MPGSIPPRQSWGESLRWCLISILSDTDGIASCLLLLSYLPSSESPSLSLLSPTGQLSLDEFIDGARKDKWVMKMLQMDVNPGGWITEQRRKSALF